VEVRSENMVIIAKRPFVYGDFNLPTEKTAGLKPTLPPGYSRYAVEILREFSPTEFVGKVYVIVPTTLQWVLLRPEDASRALWYEVAIKAPKMVKFKMQGSGQWSVQNVRTESDDQGPYVALALTNK